MSRLGSTARVSGVVLAAGESRRFGGDAPKQLYELEGKPLVRRAAETALAADLDEVLVVVGYRGEEVAKALAGLPLKLIENPRWAEGQSTSVVRGTAAVAPSSQAALFLPCDQPFLTAEVLDLLIAAYRGSGKPIVVPSFLGRRGAPTLFARTFFPQLSKLSGDAGGRQILHAHAGDILTVPLASEAALLDIDRPEDLAAIRIL